MNDFTHELAEAAFSDLARDKGKRGHAITVLALLSKMDMLYYQLRDVEIERRANHILAHVPERKLVALAEPVWELLARMGEYWEEPGEGIEAAWTAWGLAALRWMHRRARGLENVFEFERNDLADWLAEHQPEQMSLL